MKIELELKIAVYGNVDEEIYLVHFFPFSLRLFLIYF